ncbi:MAG TPA: stressosome-associated protein Prli42 [Sporosarcina sp.]|nr:stressosome-associated protein Prli42 [Sporosarcina sp.]
MSNARIRKIIVYIMIAAMVASTVMLGLSVLVG